MHYPDSVTVVNHNGTEIILLGTAHVSSKSVDEVTQIVEQVAPDSICVELCDARLKSIRDRDSWKKMDIFKILKDKKVPFLFAQLMMSSFYRKLGEDLEVTPGAEMIEGVNQAEKTGVELIMADRNIEVTLRRVWGGLSLWQRLNFLASILGSFFVKGEEIDTDTVEMMKEQDHLETAMEEFADSFPGIREPLITERDTYLAEKIKSAKGKTVLAVVGAAHVKGIVQKINENNDIEKITEIPKELPIVKILGIVIPVIIIALIAYGFQIDENIGWKMVAIWILMNGTLSAIGAAIAGGHPITVLSSFIAAPITSLNPTIGAGMVAGLVQAAIKKPTVGDIEEVPNVMDSFGSMRKNIFTRVILVFFLASLGSALGTFIAGFSIFDEAFNREATEVDQFFETRAGNVTPEFIVEDVPQDTTSGSLDSETSTSSSENEKVSDNE